MRTFPWLIFAGIASCAVPPAPLDPDAPAARAALGATDRSEALVKSGEPLALVHVDPAALARVPGLAYPLPQAAEKILAAAPLPAPLLLPNDAHWLQSARLSRGDTWVAASLAQNGMSLTTLARAALHQAPALAETLAGRADDPTITEADGVFSISFVRWGVAYTFDLACDAPHADRCAMPGAWEELERSLAVAGVAP